MCDGRMTGLNPIMITIEIAPGELIDKITILEIKLSMISDPEKLQNIRSEYESLVKVMTRTIPRNLELAAMKDELKAVNLAIWRVEDDIRDHERRQDFGASFIELARAVYKTNDRRAALKRKINQLLDSPIFEEKSYAAY